MVLIICSVFWTACIAGCHTQVQEPAVNSPEPHSVHQADEQPGSLKSALSAAGPVATLKVSSRSGCLATETQ